MYDYTCKTCSKPFQHRKPSKVFCSSKCYFSSIAETWRVERACVVCKENYIPSHKKQEYCGHRCHGKIAGKSRKNSVEITCNRCGKEFERRVSAIGKENYCSWECRKVPTSKTCKGCGKEYGVTSVNWKTSRFCSRSCAKSGVNHHFYNKTFKMPEEYEPWTKGKTVQTDLKIAELGRKISRTQKDQFSKGMRSNKEDKNPNWKNGQGVMKIRHLVRNLDKYKVWRLSVFKRDAYVCVLCGDHSSEINADHIKRFCDIIEENKIETTEQALNCEELWDIKNGRTLCVSCHKKTDTYGNKKRKNI